MQTFKGTLGVQFKVVVPQPFLDKCRVDAQQDDASPFLKQVQARHPVNDDAFIGAILSNGLRHNVRDQLLQLLFESGLGGSVSPCSIDIIETPPDFDSAKVQPQVVEPGIATLRASQVVPPPGMGGYASQDKVAA